MSFKGSEDNGPVNALVMSDDISEARKRQLLLAGIPSIKDEQIYRDWLNGKSIQEIAKKHRFKNCTVQEIIYAVQRWSNAQISDDIQGKRDVQANRYNNIYREAMKSWSKSKKPKVAKRKGSKTGGEGGDSTFEETTTQETAGDVQFLKAAISALQKIDDLYGLDAPKKTALTNAAGNGDPKVLHGVLVKNVEKLTNDELQKIIDVGETVNSIIKSKEHPEEQSE